MKKMLFGAVLFFSGIIALIGLYMIAAQSPYMVGSLTETLVGLGLIVHTVFAWVFLFIGLFICIYETYTREANEKQAAQEKAQTDA